MKYFNGRYKVGSCLSIYGTQMKSISLTLLMIHTFNRRFANIPVV